MTEFLPAPNKRMTIYEYFEIVPEELQAAFISGQRASYLPETYDQLVAIIAEGSNPNCSWQREIDDFVELIGQSSDPDPLVRMLPYELNEDGELFLNFVLPPAEMT